MRSRSIPSNAAWLLSGRLGTAGAAVVVAVIAARDLGEADFGTYAAVLAAGLFANTFVTFGTDTLVVRSVAAGAADDAVRPSLGLQWLLAAPLIVVGLVVALLVDSGAPIALQAAALAPGIPSLALVHYGTNDMQQGITYASGQV